MNPVDHGEFEVAMTQLLEEASIDETRPVRERAQVIAIQHCRRGGKTFMLHAVAAKLASHLSLSGNPIRIIFISMNSNTGYLAREGAYQVILSRVTWEISGRGGSFLTFQYNYNHYGAVGGWLMEPENRVIQLWTS
jgi:hypothetical protein